MPGLHTGQRHPGAVRGYIRLDVADTVQKSGLTNDDLIAFHEVFALTDRLLEERPHPPEPVNGLYGAAENDWYETNEESKAWKREYDHAFRETLAAYLRLRYRIGKRIGAHLMAGSIGGPGMIFVQVFPYSLFPSGLRHTWKTSRAITNKSWQIMDRCKYHLEEFPAGTARIYFRCDSPAT